MLISPAEQPWLPVMDHLFGDEQLGVGWRGSWGWGGRGALPTTLTAMTTTPPPPPPQRKVGQGLAL